MHIALDRTKRRAGASELFPNGPEPSELNAEEEEEGLVTVVGALVGLLLTVLIIVTIILVLKSRKKDRREGWREGVQEVVKGSVSTEPMLVVRMQDCQNSSEVWRQDALMERRRKGEDVASFLKFRIFFFYFYKTKKIWDWVFHCLGGAWQSHSKYWLHCNMCFSFLSYGVKVPGAAVFLWDAPVTGITFS